MTALHKLLARQLARSGLSAENLPDDGSHWHEFINRVNQFYHETDQERYLSQRSIEISSREMHELNSKLEEAQTLAMLGYWYYNRETGDNIWSKELYKMFRLDPVNPVPNLDAILGLVKKEDKQKFKNLIDRAFSHGEEYDTEVRMCSFNGKEDYRWYQVIGRPEQSRHHEKKMSSLTGITIDINKRKLAELEVLSLQQQLVTSARRAGMADVATSILHNIGNVLNSVNVSINMINEYSKQTNFEKILMAEKMIAANVDQVDTFFNKAGKKGRLIIEYLIKYTIRVQHTNQLINDELKNLMQQIDHIKSATEMQKTVSGISGLREKIYLPEVIDTALQMCGDTFRSKEIAVIKDFKHIPFITTDKSKLLQIIVNLIQNAKDALKNNHQSKKIIISMKLKNNTIQVQVKDNGIGIQKDHLIKIFGFGFTTKKTGHGFGLHSSALVAKELGGQLVASSKGPGQGATFTLTLPLDTTQEKKTHEHQKEFATHRD